MRGFRPPKPLRRGAETLTSSELIDGLGLLIVTAASELVRNTLDYGKGGHAIMEIVQNGARRGVRIVFEDQGPSIVDIEMALKDGYTSGKGD